MYPFDLGQAVGPGMPNLPTDVKLVREWLNRWAPVLHRITVLETALPSQLHQAIEHFQCEVVGETFPSGVVQPGDRTARKLKETPRAPLPTHFPDVPPIGALPTNPAPGTPLRLPPRTGFQPLSIDDYATAAKELGCETRMIRAMAKMEGLDHGFDYYNRPVILFEPLHFRKWSRYRTLHMARYHDLNYRQPAPHHYGPMSAQWKRLQLAYVLDPRASLMAVSWGRFQILGENHTYAGFSSLEAFVIAMCTSEQHQLKAFVQFMKANHLQSALVAKNWAAIALGYNGKSFLSNNYDKILKQDYESLDEK